MSAQILDGKKLAETVRREVRAGVETFIAQRGRAPGLDVVLVGDDPGSVVYTRNKQRDAGEVGMRGRLHVLPAGAPEAEIVALVRSLNANPDVDGILVQLPLPKHVNATRVLDEIDAAKDVDGFHPHNAGLLALGRPGGIVACTPAGCMRLIATTEVPLTGARAVVLGRSNTVGKPMAQLLVAQSATVTVAHSQTKDLPALCRTADVLIAAVGRPGLVLGDWIKPGAVVVDVGTSRVATADGKTRLAGDVTFDQAKETAGFLSPVPGGVGPMTIAMLLSNTLEAAQRRA